MGKIIAFWSPFVGKAKVTSSMCAIAGIFGAEFPEYSIAITHIGSDCTDLGKKLDYRYENIPKEEIYEKSGISSLKLNVRQAMLTAEKVRHSGIPLIMKSLFFYPNMEEMKYDELIHFIITKVMANEFDAVFLDLKSGKSSDLLHWINAADLVVVVLPQDPFSWKNFETYETEYLTGKKYFILLGGYMENSKFNKTCYMRKTKGNIQGELLGEVPLNIGFFDAMAEGRTLDFIYKNQKVRKKEENYEFIFQTKRAANILRKNIFISGFEDESITNASGLYRDVSQGCGNKRRTS